MTRTKAALFAVCAFALAGCAPIPSFGPSDEAILTTAANAQTTAPAAAPFLYNVVDVTRDAVNRHGFRRSTSFSKALQNAGGATASGLIGVGDVLQIQVRELSDDGLFATVGKRNEILDVQVSEAGTISLPFGGTVRAAGQSPQALQRRLQTVYQGRAVQPDIQLSVRESRSRNVVTLGDVAQPGAQQIPVGGMRLLELLARSGGVRHQPWETLVTVIRGRHRDNARLDDILDNHSQNIAMRPNDVVQVNFEPRRFPVFGAVERSGNIEISNRRATLLKVLSEAGGLAEDKAEPNSVFIYRPVSASVPTIFRLDMRDPAAFFLAESFELRERDIVYVATADARELEKFLQLIVLPLQRVSN